MDLRLQGHLEFNIKRDEDGNSDPLWLWGKESNLNLLFWTENMDESQAKALLCVFFHFVTIKGRI